MSPSNLAIVFSPILLVNRVRCFPFSFSFHSFFFFVMLTTRHDNHTRQAASPFDTSDFKASNAIITIMIDYYEPIFSVRASLPPVSSSFLLLLFIFLTPHDLVLHHHQEIEKEREAKEKQRTASQ
jgi:hypothetical protein